MITGAIAGFLWGTTTLVTHASGGIIATGAAGYVAGSMGTLAAVLYALPF